MTYMVFHKNNDEVIVELTQFTQLTIDSINLQNKYMIKK